ncbi:hypothetical protein CK203_055692 [Vitis vinifera]|uniref:Uncharacterized protein n=1 Tax=Vitis vinifera TaxID=29760 RepID=A0A438FVB1_VITVI|nr:hypothetical protein CK203_055692 [Vitis vinifera]
MSHFADIDHFSEHPDSADDSSTCPSGQIIATQTQHTAILRQIQHIWVFYRLLSTIPIPSEPTDPSQALSIEQTMPPEERLQER